MPRLRKLPRRAPRFLPALVLALLAPPAFAEVELTSPNFTLRNPTLAEGAVANLQGAGVGSIRGQGATLGQTAPVELVGPGSGTRLQGGFWPTVSPAGEDSDGDGVLDRRDNCVDEPNGPVSGPNDQVDADADGFGNVCDGDFNQDVFVGGPDFTVFLQCFNRAPGPGVGPAADPTCEESDMNADAFVGGPDFTLFLKIFNGPPGPTGLAD